MKQIEFYIAEINTNLLKTIGGMQGGLIEFVRLKKYPYEKTLAAFLYLGNTSFEEYRIGLESSYIFDNNATLDLLTIRFRNNNDFFRLGTV